MMTSIVKQQALSTLLQDLVMDGIQIPECKLSDISMDSRRVMPGCLFLSLAKDLEHRKNHLQQALNKGAFAVLYDVATPLSEDEKQLLDEAVVNAYPIADLDHQAGHIAARFYEHPSQSMTVIAVTGTNGKTSVSQFIAQTLEALGEPCGVIGTLGTGRISELELTNMTTPDPVSMQRFLAGFRAQACSYVVLEASSHALEQGRLNNVDIDLAILTNLTRDHLDYHKTMESYAAAKTKLFEFASIKTSIVNIDDDFGRQLKSELENKLKVITYSSNETADIYAEDIECHRGGVEFVVHQADEKYRVSTSLLGRFNIDNLLATIAALYELGYTRDDIQKAISCCHSITGRMEAYGDISQPMVVIDYAHTPDALQQALTTLRKHLPASGKLWCVFGCGGDRDKGKRSLMGSIAEQLADVVIITDDNPRTEDHRLIIKDILSGCTLPEKVLVEHDRKQAIIYAINHAQNEDIILVAGKGHEAYQEINHVRYPFCDATVVNDHLRYVSGDALNMRGAH